jgi:hypothetical protein
VSIPCPICLSPTRDGLVDRACTNAVLKDLASLPEWMAELDLQLTRQGQLGTGNGGRGAETPLVFDSRSSETRDLIVNTVGTWVRDMAETYADTEDPGPDMAAWCAWLVRRIERIRGHQAVRPMADELRHCVVLAIQAVDLPQVRLTCGPCPTCGKPVSAPVGADEGVCRHCSWGGVETVVKVDNSLPSVLQRARGKEISREQIVKMARLYHVPIDRRSVSRWVLSGKLKPRYITEQGTPMYNVGEVLELAGEGESVA